ncbi:MAG: diguanylate cyclase [Firmicutes bacterium]|nr:diguanylate cyclase [Bacillota bacterium]
MSKAAMSSIPLFLFYNLGLKREKIAFECRSYTRISARRTGMEQLARIFLILEMLLINLMTSHLCSRRKYSIMRIIVVLTLFTALIFLVSFFIREKLDLPYLNFSMLILLGLTYFFPLKNLYHESSDKTLAIMFFSWIHTVTVTFLAVQISTSFGYKNHFQIALIVQTIIYLFSTPVIIKFIKNRFLYILKNIPSEMNKYLVILSLVGFATISIIFIYFTESSNSLWRVITVILVGLTVAISYNLIYIIVKNFKSINFFKRLAYSDHLTGIKNRFALFLDCEELISANKPFTIIYMDLDDFKKVNDTYGHSAGDEYLKQFTKASIETVGDSGSIYRISGDEFVCIYHENYIDLFLATFDEKIMSYFGMDIPFLGVSIGYASFPQEANSIDELIHKADKVMYKVKKKTKDQLESLVQQ